MATDHAGGIRIAIDEIVQVTIQIDTDDESVTATSWPDHTDLLVGNTGNAFLTHSPSLNSLAGFRVPYPYRLIRASRYEAFRVVCPGDSEDAARVHAFANLSLCLSCLAIVQPDTLVCAYTGKDGAVWGESSPEDEAVVLPSEARVELERGTVVEDQAGVVGTGGGTERSLLTDRDGVDLRRVSRDLSHAVATVGGDAVSKALLSIANRYDALRIAVPCQVVDAACDDVVFACCLSASLLTSSEAADGYCIPFVAPSPAQSQTRTVPETSPLAT